MDDISTIVMNLDLDWQKITAPLFSAEFVGGPGPTT